MACRTRPDTPTTGPAGRNGVDGGGVGRSSGRDMRLWGEGNGGMRAARYLPSASCDQSEPVFGRLPGAASPKWR